MPEPYAPATMSTELDRQRKHAEALATELEAARAEVAAAYQHVHEVAPRSSTRSPGPPRDARRDNAARHDQPRRAANFCVKHAGSIVGGAPLARCGAPASVPRPLDLADGPTQDCTKASRSALIVSASVVGMPCGNPS
jgi:hypothetical protein